MLGLEPPIRSRVDWRRQNLMDLKRTQIRNRERRKAEEDQHISKKGPLRAHHPVSPPLLEEIDIPDLNSDASSIFNDVSLQARRLKVDEILDEIWSAQPLSDQGTYYSSHRSTRSRSRSKCSNSRISINHRPFAKQSMAESKSREGGLTSRISNSTPDLSKAFKESMKMSGTNYVKANATNISSTRRRQPSISESQPKTEVIPAKPGTIPKYLKQRRDQWKREADLKERSKPDPNCPPGHVLLSEPKRISQIEHLEHKMKELVEEFSCLPMGKNTFRIQSRKKEIEDELRQTEESLKLYAKPKVYVPQTRM